MNKTIVVIGLCIIFLVLTISGCDKESESILTQDKITCQNICENESLNLRHVSTTSTILYCHCEKIITVEVEK